MKNSNNMSFLFMSSFFYFWFHSYLPELKWQVWVSPKKSQWKDISMTVSVGKEGEIHSIGTLSEEMHMN